MGGVICYLTACKTYVLCAPFFDNSVSIDANKLFLEHTSIIHDKISVKNKITKIDLRRLEVKCHTVITQLLYTFLYLTCYTTLTYNNTNNNNILFIAVDIVLVQ